MTYDETASMLTLADGRELDLRRSGPVDGDVLVYIHGTPSSGAAPSALAEAAYARGLQLVSWSRPGYSTSTRQPGRSIASFASDAREVLDLLGIERAHALGWSGGGPHVLSLAALLPDRIRSATSLAGVAPYAETEGALDFLAGMGQDNIEEFGAALEGEAPLRQFLGAVRAGAARGHARRHRRGAREPAPRRRPRVLHRRARRRAGSRVPGGAGGIGGRLGRRRPRLRAAVGLRPRRDPGAGARLAGQRRPHGAVRARTVAGGRSAGRCRCTCSTARATCRSASARPRPSSTRCSPPPDQDSPWPG